MGHKVCEGDTGYIVNVIYIEMPVAELGAVIPSTIITILWPFQSMPSLNYKQEL